MRLIVISTLAIFALAGPVKADGVLTAAELKKLVPGNYHVVAGPISIAVKLAKGGVISGATDQGDKDTGRWHISGDRMCVKFKKWLDHQQKCEGLTQAGNELKGSAFSAWRK